MPDEGTTSGEQEAGQEAEGSAIAHEDIMKRLLEYQRQLRDGVPAAEAAEQAGTGSITVMQTEEVQVVDLTAAEAELEQAEETAEAEEIVTAEATAAEIVEADAEPEPESDAETTSEPVAEVWASSPAAGEDAKSSEAQADLADRIAALEDVLARVAEMVSELRDRFQDMAIASDEHLASIERTLAAVAASADRN